MEDFKCVECSDTFERKKNQPYRTKCIPCFKKSLKRYHCEQCNRWFSHYFECKYCSSCYNAFKREEEIEYRKEINKCLF